MSIPTISLVSESDVEQVLLVDLEAFAPSRLLAITRPPSLRDPEKTIAMRATEQAPAFRDELFRGPKAGIYVAEKAEVEGVVVGYSVWERPELHTPCAGETEDAEGPVNPEVDAAAMERMSACWKAKRDELMGDRLLWYLKCFAVLPAYQGKGIGSALLVSGLKKIDQEQNPLPVYLEATVEGVSLYKSRGFSEIGEWDLDSLRGFVYRAPVMLRESAVRSAADA